MSDIMNRTRFVDVESLPEDQLEQIQQQLGNKIREIVDQACEQANKFLNVYGMEAKMDIVIQELPKPTKE